MKKKTFFIVGLDRFGYHLAVNLEKEGHEVVGLDPNPENVRRISDLITHAAIGDPTDEDVLRSLDVTAADTAIVALSGDIETGVLVILMLKEMGIKKVIAEAASEIHSKILTRVGADKAIIPEKDLGERLAKSLGHSNIMDYIDLNDEYSIMEILTPEDWANKSLAELHIRTTYHITVIACRSTTGDLIIAPDPHSLLPADGMLVVVGKNKDIEKIIKD